MALTEAQKIKVRKVLGVHQEQQFYGGETPYTALEEKLANLSDAQIDEVETILVEYAKVEFSTGKLTGEYQDNPANKRSLLKQHVVNTIGFDPAAYGLGPSLNIGRA